MEFIKNLFKTLFKREYKQPEVIVDWEKGTMVIKSEKKLSVKEIFDLVQKQLENKENDKED